MRRVWFVPVVLFFSGFSFVAGGAAAGDPPGAGADAGTGQKVAAEDLYQQGMQLLQAGKWAEAAAKLEESNRLDRAPGTTVNLADCYEHLGKTASAWTLFVEAATIFNRRTPPDPRGPKAQARADALYPGLSRLTIDVPAEVREGAKGLVVKRDGSEVGAAQLGTAIAVDPGTHVIEASAPGKKGWKTEVRVDGNGAKASVSVPVLADAPADGGGAAAKGGVGAGVGNGTGGSGAGDSVAGDSGAAGVWAWQKKAAIGAAGAGVAGLAVGAIFGGIALGKHGDVAKECSAGQPRVCSAAGLQAVSDEKTPALVSTIGFAAGGALAAAGVVLWLAAPSGAKGGAGKSDTAARVWVAPAVGARTGIDAGVVW
jgi:hypothetical protein